MHSECCRSSRERVWGIRTYYQKRRAGRSRNDDLNRSRTKPLPEKQVIIQGNAENVNIQKGRHTMNFSKLLKKFEHAESTDERLQRIDLSRRELAAEVKQREGVLAQEERETRAAIMAEISKPTAEQEAADKKAYDAYREPAVRFLRLQKWLSDPKLRASSAYSDKENQQNDERLIAFYLSSRYNSVMELFADPQSILDRLDEVNKLQKETDKLIRDQEKAFQERAREAELLQREREEEQRKFELEELKKHRYSGPLPDCSPRP